MSSAQDLPTRTGGGDASVLPTLTGALGALPAVDLRRAADPPPPIGSGAGRHMICGELGRGGLGVVLEAFDGDLRRSVALKRPHDGRGDPRIVASLIREAQITAQLEHPNIPAVHTLGIDEEGRPFFTMTRLAGETLAQLLRRRHDDPELRRQLTIARLLRIFLQVGYALAFAHSKGVLHRDLKPSNVFLGEFGEVRLIDWGIARLIDAKEDDPTAVREPVTVGEEADVQTRVGSFVGTPGYAAPEQIEAELPLDERADVYALGVILYELLAGRPPIAATTPMARAAATIQGTIVPIRTVLPVSERLAAVVHKALALRREDRYASVLALLRDIEAILEGRPVTAQAEGVLTRMGRFYMARTERIARLRFVDIDLLCWGSFVGGIATGVWLAPQIGGWATWLGVLCAALLAAPLHTVLRKPRPEDPGVLIPYTEAATTVRGGSGEPARRE